jgi:GEVED domain/Secretion system C-terminal sorting domain
MYKIFLTTIIFIILSNVAFAQKYKQMMEDNRVNFYDVVKEAESYFKDKVNREKERFYETGVETEEDEEFEMYYRWRYENESKYYPSGDRLHVDHLIAGKAMQQFIKNNPVKNIRNLNADWRDLGPYSVDSISGHYAPGLGRLEDVWVSKTNANKMYVVARGGGFWKTLDGGVTWIGGVSDTMIASGIGTLDVNPTNEDEILINVRNGVNASSYGVYRSINGGTSFSPTPFHYTNPVLNSGGLGSGFSINRIKYHPLLPNIVFIGSGGSLWRSANSLTTYTKVINTEVRDIAFHPTNAAIIYCYNSNNPDRVMRSIDTGKTWIQGPLLPSNNGKILLLSTSPNCASCIFATGDGGFFKSTDAGVTFAKVGGLIDNDQGFAVSDLDTSIMVAGYINVFNSLNGGLTFNQTSWWNLGDGNGIHGLPNGNNLKFNFGNTKNYVHADLARAICVNGIFYIVTDGYLCKSLDSAKTWKVLSQGVGTRDNFCVGTSQSNHYISYCGSQDNGQSLRVKNTWVETYGADGMRCVVAPLNENWLTGSVQEGSRKFSYDQGQTIINNNSPQSGGVWVAPYLLDPNNQTTLYDFKDSVFKTTDWGASWSYVGKPSSFVTNIFAAAIAYDDSRIILISSNNVIEKSIDGGATFTPITNNLPNLGIKYITIDPANDNTFIVVYDAIANDGKKIYKSQDGGNTWTNITHNLGNMPIKSVIIDNTPAHNIYIGAEVGAFTMPMNSTNWVRFGNNLPNVPVREMDINYGSNTLKAATWGRGLWEHTLVGRDNYPAIVKTNITDAPTLTEPKETLNQYVTSSIHYSGALSSVYTMWSFDSMSFANILPMTNISDSTYKTNAPLPNTPVGNKVFFKVVAVGSAGDTSITYKFQYTIREFKYCTNTTNQNNGSHYIRRVILANINNNTNAWNPGTASATGGFNPIYFNNVVGQLYADSTYTVSVKPYNSGFSQNDMGVWIDFNNDAVFNTDNEQIMYKINQTGDPITATFTVPQNAVTTDTIRMRVSHGYFTDSSNFGPCLNNRYGETEDYAIVVSKLSAPLALENIKLDAKRKDNNVLLHWTSIDKANANPFSLEVSKDFMNWQIVATEKAAGKNEYDYIVADLKNEINIFRISQINANNQIIYSNTRMIANNNQTNKIFVYPNPANDILNVESTFDISTKIIITDNSGKKIIDMPAPNQNINSIKIDINAFKSGMYILKIANLETKFIKE